MTAGLVTTNTTEWYAESRQLVWVEIVVIPYLQETYPAEVKLLDVWMQEHIGLVLPLRILTGDARIRAKKHGNYYWRNTFGSSANAFEQFVRAIDAGQDITEARLDLAIGLTSRRRVRLRAGDHRSDFS